MRRYLLLIIGSLTTLFLDQWSKIWAVGALSLGKLPEDAYHIQSQSLPLLEGLLDFRLTGNKGAAWGLFRSLPDEWRVPFFVIVSVIAVIVIVSLYRKAEQQTILRLALTLILGGTLGNLVDRFRLGYVIDFIHCFYKDYHWPIFNIADIAITIGVGLLAIDMIRQRRVQEEVKALQ